MRSKRLLPPEFGQLQVDQDTTESELIGIDTTATVRDDDGVGNIIAEVQPKRKKVSAATRVSNLPTLMVALITLITLYSNQNRCT